MSPSWHAIAWVPLARCGHFRIRPGPAGFGCTKFGLVSVQVSSQHLVANGTVEDFVRSRRSSALLVDPAPDDADLLRMVAAASAAPDHGKLSPWRLVLVRDLDRRALDDALVDAQQSDTTSGSARRGLALRAPLLVGIVFCPRPAPRIPRWEQLAAVCCMVSTLGLLLHAENWGAIWRTGRYLADPGLRTLLALTSDEELLGWLYVGTDDHGPRPARPDIVLPDGKVTSLETHSK